MPPAGSGGTAPSKAPQTLRELELESKSAVSLTVHRVIGDVQTEMALPVLGGGMTFETLKDGQMVLESLDIVLDDAVVPTQDGRELKLTDVRLSLSEPVTAALEWTQGSSGFWRAQVPLALNWKLVGDSGTAWPLATQKLTGLTLYVHVETDPDGRWHVDAFGHNPGTFWQWSGIYSMSDAVMTLDATEVLPEPGTQARTAAIGG